VSLIAIQWVFDHSRSDGGDRLVLLVLANHANDDWICWPGQKRIAEHAAMNPRNVKRHIHSLETVVREIEILERGSGRQSTRYRIRGTNCDTPTTSDRGTNCDTPTPTTHATPGVPTATPGGVPTATPKSSSEPSGESSSIDDEEIRFARVIDLRTELRMSGAKSPKGSPGWMSYFAKARADVISAEGESIRDCLGAFPERSDAEIVEEVARSLGSTLGQIPTPGSIPVAERTDCEDCVGSGWVFDESNTQRPCPKCKASAA
jgi:hypothetical protein